jgi:hypothetical protein
VGPLATLDATLLLLTSFVSSNGVVAVEIMQPRLGDDVLKLFFQAINNNSSPSSMLTA